MEAACDILIRLLNKFALKRGEFILSSGKSSSYYLDVRQVTLRYDGALAIARMMGVLIGTQPEQIHAVGGMVVGADPIVGALLASEGTVGLHLRGFLVRKEAKAHGTGRLVEGPVEAGMNVVIVEDVATTGASALAAADAVLALGCRVMAIVPVVDRLEGAAEACIARGIPFLPLLTVRDLGVEPE